MRPAFNPDSDAEPGWDLPRAERAARAAAFLELPRNHDGTGRWLDLHALEQAANACEMVLAFFRGDEAKARTWFHTPNGLLRGVEPRLLVVTGRGEELVGFIRDAIAHNTYP